MSYCRFSDDDFQCDVYCYADVDGGYKTWVAKTRPAFTTELPEKVTFDKEHMHEWMERHQKIIDLMDSVEYKPICLKHDGEDFWDETAKEAGERLKYLKGLGYNVPDYAIEALMEEDE